MRDLLRDILSDVLPPLLSTIVAYAVVLARRWLNIQANSEAGQAINRAAERAAAVVYQRVVGQGVPLSDDATIARLVGEASMTAEARVTEALQRRGVASNDFYQMVRSDFARWIAADPSVPGPRTTTKE